MAILSLSSIIPTIPSKDFNKTIFIGQGGFGKVYQGTWGKVAVAIKELLVQTTDSNFSKEFEHEAKVMSRCQHPKIVKFWGVCLEPGNFSLIMEQCKGSLYDLLKDNRVSLLWPKKYSFASHISEGLAYLHSQKVIHSDLSSHNILLAEEDIAKISDFGLAKIRLETSDRMSTSQQGGAVRWMAPELFEPGTKVSFASDIYSLGVIFWEIASRKIPFHGAMNNGQVGMWRAKKSEEDIPSDCPQEYAQIIQKCWTAPKDRPSAKDVLNVLDSLQRGVLAEDTLQPSNTSVTGGIFGSNYVLAPDMQLTNFSFSFSLPHISHLNMSTINPATSNLPNIAFGKAEWAKYFGDIGVEPPLPADIQAILQSPCPFWSNKKVQDTHLLVLVPQTVNGTSLTLKYLGEFIQKPLQGPSTKYTEFDLGEYKDIPNAKSHWALLTRDVIEGSRDKSYSEQQALIEGKKQYEVPTILDATVAILMEHVRTGTRLYSDSPYTIARCQEKYNKYDQVGVGGFSGGGLSVDSDIGDYCDVGAGGLRKF